MAYVYILYSELIDKFYTGSTTYTPEDRLAQHNSKKYSNAYTSKGVPWIIYLHFKCESKTQAIKIENHIKNMKSRKYILNLKSYPEIIDKLKGRYPD